MSAHDARYVIVAIALSMAIALCAHIIMHRLFLGGFL